MLVKSLLFTIAIVCHSYCITCSMACCEVEIECQDESCTKCYKTLATQLLKNDTNYIELQNKFFPSNSTGPDFVIVTYVYHDDLEAAATTPSNHVWFWSSSGYFFYHPLRIFQYTSLGFSDPSLTQTELTLHLPASCYDEKSVNYNQYMQLLTQRVRYPTV